VVRAGHLSQHSLDLISCQDYGNALRAFGSLGSFDEWQLDQQYFTVKKEQRSERHVLRRGGDVFVSRQV
jgi:hypothetical protein